MVGMGRIVGGERLRSAELLVLRAEGSGLVYHARPTGQAPTDFTSTHVDGDSLAFENRAHDFPQAIRYSRQGDRGMRVGVYADADGDSPAFTLPFLRVPCPGL